MRLILTFGIDPVSPLRFIIVISNTIAALPGKFGTKVTDLKRAFVQSGQGKSIILQFLNAAVCVFKIHIRHSGLRNGNFDGIGHIASSCGYRCLTHGFTCQQAIFINGSNTLIRNTPGNGIRCACRCQLCFQLHRGARFQRNRFTIFDRHCGCRNGFHDNLDCIRNRTDCYGNICLTFCYTSDLTGSSIHADNAIINTAPNHCICGITGRHGCLQRCTFMDTQFHFFALINFYHSCADSQCSYQCVRCILYISIGCCGIHQDIQSSHIFCIACTAFIPHAFANFAEVTDKCIFVNSAHFFNGLIGINAA